MEGIGIKVERGSQALEKEELFHHERANLKILPGGYQFKSTQCIAGDEDGRQTNVSCNCHAIWGQSSCGRHMPCMRATLAGASWSPWLGQRGRRYGVIAAASNILGQQPDISRKPSVKPKAFIIASSAPQEAVTLGY